MPCYDGRENIHTIVEYRKDPNTVKKLEWAEAALCMLMKHIAEGQLTKQDFKNAGITRAQLADWWKAHKAKDDARLAKEAAAAKAERDKLAALNKLTMEERKLLGLCGL